MDKETFEELLSRLGYSYTANNECVLDECLKCGHSCHTCKFEGDISVSKDDEIVFSMNDDFNDDTRAHIIKELMMLEEP
jgi:hypothetical protein